MKIGLVTIYHVPNYGSVLQAYATQMLLKSLGYDCEIIQYKYPNRWHFDNGFPKPNNLKIFLHKFGLRTSHRGEIKINLFRKRFLNFTRLFNSLEDLRAQDWADFGCFIAGSDQVWNAKYVLGDSVFMLSFVPPEIPRLSFSSSFALKELPDNLIPKYRYELSQFRALSVREENGKQIIIQQLKINKDVFVCLDPTLLLDKTQWLKIIPRSRFNKKAPYILLYMLNYAFEPRPYVYEILAHYQKRLNCTIRAIAGYSKSYNLNMMDMSDVSVPEFIDLFANADLIVTSSFHGTAFGINFGRPLISLVPNNNDDDRQTSFLRRIGAHSCIAPIDTNVENINPYYDTSVVANNLGMLRNKCICWLEKNLRLLCDD